MELLDAGGEDLLGPAGSFTRTRRVAFGKQELREIQQVTTHTATSLLPHGTRIDTGNHAQASTTVRAGEMQGRYIIRGQRAQQVFQTRPLHIQVAIIEATLINGGPLLILPLQKDGKPPRVG